MDANDEVEAKARLPDRLRRFWHYLRNANHRNVARAAVAAHLSYYSLVFVEAHGWYGYAGGLCGIVLLVEVLIGHDDKEEK